MVDASGAQPSFHFIVADRGTKSELKGERSQIRLTFRAGAGIQDRAPK